MSNRLSVHNRQRAFAIDTRLLGQITLRLLCDLLQVPQFELAVYIVGPRGMTRLNEGFLQHRGSTDVLAFDYSEQAGPTRSLQGEIFVCAEEAMVQSARFRTDWRNELVRYVIHGTLHLLGHDDHQPRKRQKMKRVENAVLMRLAAEFALKRVGSKKAPGKPRSPRAGPSRAH